jgi:hypothetical protein
MTIIIAATLEEYKPVLEEIDKVRLRFFQNNV